MKNVCVSLHPQCAAAVVVTLFAYLSFLQEEDPLYVTSIREMQWPARNYGRTGYVYIIFFFTLHTHEKWCTCETGSGLILQLSRSVGSGVMPYLLS